MSFKLFIYYCSLCGGWAAFLTWGFVLLFQILSIDSPTLVGAIVGGLAGMSIAAAVGLIDAMQQSSVWMPRLIRAGVAAVIGLIGGVLSGAIGTLAENLIGIPLFFGWTLAGLGIGIAVGAYDVLLAVQEKREIRLSIAKLRNGVIGGVAGGLAGGLLFWVMRMLDKFEISTLAWGLVIVGVSVGLLIGLAQVVLKEAWLQIEVARRPGKQIIINKDKILIGRSEQCDVGLFGEQGIEKEHAKIVILNNRYMLSDEGTPGGTFLNDVRVNKPMPLKGGDAIRMGSCVLRFNERAKARK